MRDAFHPAGQGGGGGGGGTESTDPFLAPLPPSLPQQATNHIPEQPQSTQSGHSISRTHQLPNHVQDRHSNDQSHQPHDRMDVIPDGDAFDDLLSDLGDDPDLTTPPDSAVVPYLGKENGGVGSRQDDFRARILNAIKTCSEKSPPKRKITEEEEEMEKRREEEEEEDRKRRGHSKRY